jgi:hypothetical protein
MFTHTFEIEAADVGKLEGEISFNGPNNQPPRVKFNTGPEMEVKEYSGVGNLFHALISFFQEAGEITKISVEKK